MSLEIDTTDRIDEDVADDEVIDLTEARSSAAVERVIDLRSPGQPYTYPASPRTAGPDPEPIDTSRFAVTRGSADVATAPPDADAAAATGPASDDANTSQT